MTEAEFLDTLKKTPLYKLVQLPVGFLKHPEYSTRKIDQVKFNALIASMDQDKDFMKVRPIIVNIHEGREGIIIAGNQRYDAAEKLAWETVWCALVDVDAKKEKEWNIKDNLHQGETDEFGLRDVLAELRDDGYDLTGIGFAPDDLVDALEGPETEMIEKGDDYEGTTPKKSPKVKIAEGAELECPSCHTKFTYGVGVSVTPADVAENE